MKTAIKIKRPNFASLTILGLTAILSGHTASAAEELSIPEQGKALMQAFSAELKGELKKAIKEGGLKNGIEVCSMKAPTIAAKHSDNNWQIKRTSLKVRNPANTATESERETLLQFQAKKDTGATFNELSLYQVEKTATGKTHKLMKAIPTKALCLGCHGDNLAKDLTAELALRYPEDQATGFKEGDIRGAFSLIYHEQN